MKLYLDHISLHVSDVERSLFFYTTLLGMEVVDRPAFGFGGAWLQMNGGIQLHLIAGKDYETRSSNRGNHIAFRTDKPEDVLRELAKHNVMIVSDKTRVDGVRQIFVKDPDGYYVEINTA